MVSEFTVMLGLIYLGRIPDILGLRFDVVDCVPVTCGFAGWYICGFGNGDEDEEDEWVFDLWNLYWIAGDSRAGRVRSEEDGVDGDGGVAVRKNPAVKLHDFLNGLWRGRDLTMEGGVGESLRTERALDASPKMRGLDAVRGKWMGKWVEFVGEGGGRRKRRGQSRYEFDRKEQGQEFTEAYLMIITSIVEKLEIPCQITHYAVSIVLPADFHFGRSYIYENNLPSSLIYNTASTSGW
ncbi:putative ochratoxin a non-ribosomal peptide synthetase protein [Botrytis fragariae]|uniref:Putative ochratoxin a non-ribosomal peptide synthetase protein n=1 Tax=Botrytis fragariae TaxID=1964551 RepID=A0A8H6EG58_9HELO|nr:putative ochratoxin a non-ribosomal peptide synthetase protein [Botrytis fragariae]KAF5870931.1 putative ochratoxin a non-ribosomal peptide synthetase protein [Botrytis fragariae]